MKTETENKSSDNKTQQIERDLADTRGAVEKDIKALGDKLSPDHLKSEAKQALHSAADKAADKLSEVKNKATDKLIEAKDEAAEKLSETKQLATEKLVEAKQVTSEKLAEAKQVTSEKLHEVGEAASETFDEVSYQARRAGDATLRFARDNAVPLALIGIGASLLWANGRRRSPRLERDWYERDERDRYRNDLAWDDAYRAETSRPYEPLQPHRYPQNGRRELPKPAARASSLRQRAGEATESVGHRAHDAVDSARHAAERAGEGVSDLASRASERVGAAYEQTTDKLRSGLSNSRAIARDQLGRLRNGSRELVQDNPLAVSVLALASGIGIGLLLPESERENRLYGPARDQLLGEAREAARDLREAAREVVDAAKQSASSI